LITTASPINNNIEAKESIQIQQGTKLWTFKKCIQQRTDAHTTNNELTRTLIDKSPGFVGPNHFAFLWFWHFEEILSRIHSLDEGHKMNVERLEIAASTIERSTAWQKLLHDIYETQTESPEIGTEITIE